MEHMKQHPRSMDKDMASCDDELVQGGNEHIMYTFALTMQMICVMVWTHKA